MRQTSLPRGSLRLGAVADPSPLSQLARLVDGYMTTQLLYVAAKLGIADALATGPLSLAAIAETVGADAAFLRRALRGLVLEDVLQEGRTAASR
jgi:Dimerisation domain